MIKVLKYEKLIQTVLLRQAEKNIKKVAMQQNIKKELHSTLIDLVKLLIKVS